MIKIISLKPGLLWLHRRREELLLMNHCGWLEKLVGEMGQAAQAGYAQTARLAALLTVATVAVAFVLVVMARY